MKRLTEQLIAFTGRHLALTLYVLLLLGILALFPVLNGSYTNDVSLLFPRSGEAANTFRVLRETRLSGTVNVEFISAVGIGKYRRYLGRTAAKLGRTPGVHNVLFRYRSGDVLDEWSSFSRLVPRFFTPDVLNECDPDDAAKNALKQLAFPVPGGTMRLRRQPFGIENRLLTQLKLLDELSGMRIAPELDFLATRDHRRAMIVFDADVGPGDAAAVRKIFSRVREAIEPIPTGLKWRIVSGANHTLGNEATLKRDATVAGAVSLVLFALLFWIFYRRDPRALWIPVVPMLASLLTLGVMALVFKEICMYVIGLGSCITGLAVDQGIHVYAACRAGNGARRTAALAEPMALSAGSSILVFILLGATGVGAYIQLAVFAGGALLLSALIALSVLPHLFGNCADDAETLRVKPRKLPRAAAWGIVTLLAVAAVPGTLRILDRADFSLASLDGTPKHVLAEEADFNAAWRKEGTRIAVLAAVDAEKEAALAKLRRCAAKLASAGVRVAALPRPPIQEQTANRELWRSAETRAALEKLESACRESCRRHKLPERFFDPFFRTIADSTASQELTLPPMLEHLERKMLKTRPGGAAAAALLEDTPENAVKVRNILREEGNDDLALFAREGFRTMIKDELGGRFEFVMILSAAGALALLYIVFRNWRDMLLAMVPVFTAFSALAALGGTCGFRATPAAAFALVLLTGLAADYGVYAVCGARSPGELSVETPVLLSAATTVAGAGALIFSHHPALYGTGVVLALGVTFAAAGGLFLVPALRCGGKKTHHALCLVTVFTASLLVSGCASAPEDPAVRAEAERELAIYPDRTFRVRALATLSGGGGMESHFILAAEVDPGAGTVKASGVDPGSGVLIFRGDTANAVADAGMFPQLPPAVKEVFRGIPGDLARIFIFKREDLLAVRRKAGYIAADSRDGVVSVIRSGAVERRSGNFPFRSWECLYRDSGRSVDYLNHDGGYRIRIAGMNLKQRDDGR